MERLPKSGTSAPLAYSPAARRFHWWTVAFVTIMLPLGLYMVKRGHESNFDSVTGRLYDLHKLLGFVLLWVVVARLAYRFRHGAPAGEPTLEWWQKAAAHLTHWCLYGLLLAMPLMGWIGVSLYGARSIFGVFSLPAITGESQAASETVFMFHYFGAMALVALLCAHVGAALFHHFIRRDGVLRRMIPRLRQWQ